MSLTCRPPSSGAWQGLGLQKFLHVILPTVLLKKRGTALSAPPPPPPPRHRTGSAGSCRGRGSPESDHEEAAGLQGAFSRNGVCCRDYGSTERLAGWARCVHQVTGMLGVCSTTRQEHIPSQGRTRGRLSREPPCLQMQWILP